MTVTVSLRTSEDAEFDPAVTADSADLPVVANQDVGAWDNGVLVVGSDTYVWNARTGHWQLPAFTATGT